MQKNHSLANDATWLISHVNSLKNVLPSFAVASTLLSEKTENALDKFIDSHASDKTYDASGNLEEFRLDSNYASRYQFLKRIHQDHLIFASLLPKMTVVSLVSVYDAYLGRLLKNIFTIKPEILNGCSRQITFAELMEFGSIDSARDHIIEKEIECILRDNHTTQIEWIGSRLGTTLTDLPSWKYFIELTERRNLLVHADGVISKQYIEACRRVGYELPADAIAGAKLSVSPKYFSKACQTIAEIGIKLNQVIWRKLLPRELKQAEDSFINVTFDLLSDEDYSLAELLLNFSKEPAFKKLNAESTLYLKINLAISLKGQDKEEECKKIISEIDFSALSDKFKLASAVLLDDFESAVQIMKKIGNNGEIGKTEYKEWPLFKWLRRKEEFKEAYEEIFNEQFSLTGSHSLSEIFDTDDLQDLFDRKKNTAELDAPETKEHATKEPQELSMEDV